MARNTLTRLGVLKAALQLLEEQGVEAVTMRNVAAALGTKPMSLYNHVADKDDLLNGVFEVVLSEVEFTARVEATWQERFRAAAHEYRAAFMRHPSAIPNLHRRLQSSRVWLEMFEWALANLREAGFSAPAARGAYTTLATLVLGFTLNEVWYHQQIPSEGDPELPVPNFDLAFAFAIDTVIAGLELQLEKGRRHQ